MKTNERGVTTITLGAEAYGRISNLTDFVGGNVASFCAFWGRELSDLTPEQLRSVREFVKSLKSPKDQNGAAA